MVKITLIGLFQFLTVFTVHRSLFRSLLINQEDIQKDNDKQREKFTNELKQGNKNKEILIIDFNIKNYIKVSLLKTDFCDFYRYHTPLKYP